VQEGGRFLLFIGDDWAEGHHDVVVQDEAGATLARRRLPEGADGIARFHELAASHWGGDGEPDPAQVIVVIETDRGPWVKALAATGYRVYPVNPKQAHRHRETVFPPIPFGPGRRRAVRESLSTPVVAVIKGEGNKPERCLVRVTSARPGAGRAQPPARSESRYRTVRDDCLGQLARHCARQKLRFSKNFGDLVNISGLVW
jgi:hypothetical protein